MFYSRFVLIFMSASLFGRAIAGPIQVRSSTEEQVVANIQTLNNISAALMAPAQGINLLDPILLLDRTGRAWEVVVGLHNISTTISADISQWNGIPQITNEQQESIFVVVTSFVEVHQKLLSTLIEKAGLFKATPGSSTSIYSALKVLETSVDALALYFIQLLQNSDKVATLTQSFKSLDGTFTKAIEAYDQGPF